MNGQSRAGPARLSSYHGPKRQLLGTHVGQAAPAWRAGNLPTGPSAMGGASSSKSLERGSKILLSNLPADVGQEEVEELFKRTVGPMKDSFLIYNNKGRSKGMAVVTFQRPGDARMARIKYDNKIVDNRHRIKVEIVVDNDEPSGRSQPPPKPTGPPSLLSRIAGSVAAPFPPAARTAPTNGAGPTPPAPKMLKKITSTRMPAGPKKRLKKGPKRVKKTVAQLDQEMEEYRATAVPMDGEEEV